ncbi:hypothetical protein VFPPC_14588 [Pochonia chlamydosporia 170]|uniref:Uncharacterized protein n=1 Tax=Pochonia chlamydosporia 170 TaxID=1380566 RepID=A0A179F872_METCM|nr:hypothetical protein VFPPC_14588 [Pochonia chlamydosporia 170]OAQ61540.1 hypothetical protein VFPPC_14588 [Pochonia chlamydosporia 170]
MDAGGLAQMSSSNFNSANGLPMPAGGLASRRGGQNIKPLSFDAIKQGNANKDGGVPTPRTSRSHLLAGLRTAPKSATAATFGPTSPVSNATPQQYARRSIAANLHGYGQESAFNAVPKTAFPQYGAQQSSYQNMMGNQQYTVDQVLAPPELSMDEQAQEHMDPNLYAQLVATNLYLAQQQQRLQQQLRNVQAAAQQFQQLNLSSAQHAQLAQQQMALYEQQQQLRNMQQQLGVQAAISQGQQVYYNPATGQYYVDNSSAVTAQQVSSPYVEQPMSPTFSKGLQQQLQQHQFQQQQQQYQQSQQGTPRVQVSPPPENHQTSFRTSSPPKRYESPSEVTPLPPPSANAFRRGHKKASSLAPVNSALAALSTSGDAPKSAGPKTASFPLTPLTGGYGPGQARAGEHPVRQPRGPPSLDELKSKPTAKHEGSKNFAARTRRSAVHNLVRAGLERRKGTSSSAGSMSPVSETAEDSCSPITDNDSDSGRSGSGSLAGEEECTSSRTSASGSWGAIGSDRPSSRQKARGSVDSIGSNEPVFLGEAETTSSFANVFKNGALRATKAQEATDAQRKAPRLVLTSVEKRKATPVA